MKKFILPIMLYASSFAYAQYPSDFTIEGLERDYIASKTCKEACGTTLGINIKSISDSRIVDIDINVSATQLTVIPLPFKEDSFLWKEFLLNGKKTNAITSRDGKIFVAVPKGNNVVSFSAKMKSGQNNIEFLEDPKGFENTSGKYAILKQVGGSFFLQLETIKEAQVEVDEQKVSLEIFGQPLYSIKRELFLSEKWKMKTTISPFLSVAGNKVSTIKVPLLNGEQPMNSELEIVDGSVSISVGSSEVSWESSLTPKDKMTFKNTDTKNIETWVIYNENNWLYSYDGLNPISSVGNNRYKTINTWSMWPNEKVDLSFSLPKVIDGITKNVTNLNFTTNWKNDPLVHDVSFSINTSIGGRYVIDFEDKKAEIIGLVVGGRKIEGSIKDGKLALDLFVGENTVNINYKSGTDSIFYKTPIIKFETAVTNAKFINQLDKRWLLFAGGGDIRPAVLLWGILIALGLIAVVLGKTLKTPLGIVSWLLLLFGLAQTSLIACLLVVGWLAAYGYRDKLIALATHENVLDAKKFNRIQVGLGILTGFGLITLISMVAIGLLDNPEIFVLGHQSSSNYLSWYVQSWDGEVKNPWIVSLPISVYRGIMLAWAVWLAFSLMTWLKWMWQEYSKGGYWIKDDENSKKEVAETSEKVVDSETKKED
jgi:hypothetical protein